MATSTIQKKAKYTTVAIAGLTINPTSFLDVDTGIVPQSQYYQVANLGVPWCFIMGTWIDNTIKVRIANPMAFSVTTDAYSTIRIFWL